MCSSGCDRPIFNKTYSLCRSSYAKKYRIANRSRIAAREKALRLKHPDRVAAQGRKHKVSLRGRYLAAKSEAARRGLYFKVSFEYFTQNLTLPCEYCAKIESIPNTGHRMDRIENSMGYCKNNVVPCCPDCNVIRRNKLSYIEMLVGTAAINKLREELQR